MKQVGEENLLVSKILKEDCQLLSQLIINYKLNNRPGVAGAVLQTPVIHSLIH